MFKYHGYSGPCPSTLVSAKKETGRECEHLNFSCECDVNRLSSEKDGPVNRYCLDVRVKCTECGLPFRFIGLPTGIDLNGAAVSIDGTEGRFAIAPKGQVISQLESDGDVTGFTVRRIVEQAEDK